MLLFTSKKLLRTYLKSRIHLRPECRKCHEALVDGQKSIQASDKLPWKPFSRIAFKGVLEHVIEQMFVPSFGIMFG